MSIPQSGGGPIERPEQLAEYLEAGCKTPEDWRIGTEHEKFGYCRDTLKPLPYEGERSVRAVLEGLQQRFGWSPVFSRATTFIRGWRNGRANVEPRARRTSWRLSGAPLEDDPPDCDEVNEHLAPGARGGRPDRRGLHRSGGRPDLEARRDADDAQGAHRLIPTTWTRVRPRSAKTNDVPDLHGAGEPSTSRPRRTW